MKGQIFLKICALVILILFVAVITAHTEPAKEPRNYFELRIYHLSSGEQETAVELFLQKALLPALHRANVKKVGVFKPVANDTAADKKIYVFIPYSSLKQFEQVPVQLKKDPQLANDGQEYLNAPFDKPLFNRVETIILHAFEDMPTFAAPQLTSARSERIYELRSYESASEKLFLNKVEMFNKGGEVTLFKRLGFNAVFYGEVLSGSRMPNLMYMTSFENMSSRDAHWKAFGSDPEWKKLSAMKEYQKNVSKIDIVFLRPAAYSDL